MKGVLLFILTLPVRLLLVYLFLLLVVFVAFPLELFDKKRDLIRLFNEARVVLLALTFGQL